MKGYTLMATTAPVIQRQPGKPRRPGGGFELAALGTVNIRMSGTYRQMDTPCNDGDDGVSRAGDGANPGVLEADRASSSSKAKGVLDVSQISPTAAVIPGLYRRPRKRNHRRSNPRAAQAGDARMAGFRMVATYLR